MPKLTNTLNRLTGLTHSSNWQASGRLGFNRYFSSHSQTSFSNIHESDNGLVVCLGMPATIGLPVCFTQWLEDHFVFVPNGSYIYSGASGDRGGN